MSQLSAGAFREIITPPVGAHLFGYRPDVISTSVNDDLSVTAAAFEDGGSGAILICATICEIATFLADELRAAVSEAVGIPASNVIISATHTHSGPITVEIAGWGDIDRDFCYGILIPRAVSAAKKAWDGRRPAKLGVGVTDSQVGINRREIRANGDIVLGQNPWGMYDPAMTVLSLRGLDGSPILNLIHYCCHGTAAGCNTEISRDWSGPMIDRLEEQSKCLTVFFNGAEGDIGPRLSNGLTVGDITYVRELGAVAANDAVRAYRTIKEYREDCGLSVVSGEISLPYKALPPENEVDAALARYNAGNPDALINIDRLEYDRLVRLKKAYADGDTSRTHFTFNQTLIAIGPVLIIPFPYEIFVEVTLRLRAYSGFAYTLCLSNTNGANSYFPSRDQISRGGYEIRTFTAGGTFCLTDDADDNIIRENLKLIEKL